MDILKKINYILDRKQKIIIIGVFIILVIGGWMELLGVSLIFPLINVITDEDSAKAEWWFQLISKITGITEYRALICAIIFGMVFIYIIKNIYIIFMYHVIYKFTYTNRKKLAMRLLHCYVYQDYTFHLNKNMAELQRNIVVDIGQFYGVISDSLYLLNEVFTSLFIVVYLLTMDVITTVSVSILLGIALVLFFKIQRTRQSRLGAINRESQGMMNKWILQTFSGIKEIKILGREKYFIEQCENYYKQHSDANRKSNIASIMAKPIMESICVSGLLSVIAIRILQGADMTYFISVLAVFAVAAFRMLPSFNRISSYLATIFFQKESVHSVFADIKEAEQYEKNGENLLPVSNIIDFQDTISFDNVSFKYDGTEKWILDNINLSISKNQSIAIIGASGAGKSTLVDVLLGLLKPDEGHVCVDGKDIHDNISGWNHMLGYIPQSIYLMDDTIRNNIAFGIPEEKISDEKIKKAIEQAQLTDFIRDLEKGIDTEIGDRGVRISGGQRQRIGIARALYNDPQILVFDEATSALDNETEEDLMIAINGLKGTRTMIIIAHRLHTIKDCDQIYLVENGKVIPKSHEEVFENEVL